MVMPAETPTAILNPTSQGIVAGPEARIKLDIGDGGQAFTPLATTGEPQAVLAVLSKAQPHLQFTLGPGVEHRLGGQYADPQKPQVYVRDRRPS